jgi:hypothetical protein
MEMTLLETMLSWMSWENTLNYGLQTLLLLSLTVITFYRKEFSCNHCYSENLQPQQQEQQQSTSADATDRDTRGNKSKQPPLPVVRRILRKKYFRRMNLSLPLSNWKLVTTSEDQREGSSTEGKRCVSLFPAMRELTEDAVVEILSFLHPQDLMEFAMVNRDTMKTIDENYLLWKALWYRDYAWLVENWNVGQKALTRSLRRQCCTEFTFSKEFYFRFGLCYLNYLLAGQCTVESCFVGLRGHIYDLTSFLSHHPGSPETLLAHAGRDATSIFECLRHSLSARRLAQDLCVIVDCRTQPGGCGARPTRHCFPSLTTSSSTQSDTPVPLNPPSAVDPVSPSGCPAGLFGHTGTIESIRDAFLQEQHKSSQQAASWLAVAVASKKLKVLGDVHTYYDPFCAEWKAWYMSADLKVVFVDFNK